MEPNLRAALGKRIRLLRKASILTIEELAFRSGIHTNYLGDIERGQRNPSLDNLEKIAVGLRIHISELFPKGSPANPREQQTYCLIRPLLSLVRDRSNKDREFILDVAKAAARHLRAPKHSRAGRIGPNPR
ncbi:MAG: helix-turn-helix transcriptional regulator [Elusimicrobia bacterium]|nr:helix-turn-helix transcriptional regulator [Elusimicrobiota bacterium]